MKRTRAVLFVAIVFAAIPIFSQTPTLYTAFQQLDNAREAGEGYVTSTYLYYPDRKSREGSRLETAYNSAKSDYNSLVDTLALQVIKGEKKPHVDQTKAQASLANLAKVASDLKSAFWKNNPSSPGAADQNNKKTTAENNLTEMTVGLDAQAAKGVVDKAATATSNVDIGTMVGNAIVTIYKGVSGAKATQRQEVATRLSLGKWPDFATLVNPTGKTETTIKSAAK